MSTSLWFMISLLSGWNGSSAAAPSATDEPELPSVEDTAVPPEVFLVSDARKQDCPRVGTVCLFGHGGGTIAGLDVNPTVGIVTTLARGIQVAGPMGRGSDADVWNVEMIARLQARPLPGDPIIVAILDYADPEGMARKEATAVWQIEGAIAKDLGLRLVLSADDGFLPRHTYLIRMVQGTGAREKVLAQANFLLE